MLIREPTMILRDWTSDSRRWADVPMQAGDIIVATSPKCGTTWTQRIIGMLLRQSAAPFAIQDEYPWVDMRSKPLGMVQAALAEQAATTGRRSIKTHSPFDALPLHDDICYVHVTCDPRDAAMSWHNHVGSYTPLARGFMDHVGQTDEKVGMPFPPFRSDAQGFFRQFLELPGYAPPTEFTLATYAATGRSYWLERHRPNVLLVHYNDLITDLDGEMRRIAAFCDLPVDPAIWPVLVAAADFAAMKRDGAALMPTAAMAFTGGADRFLHKGTNQRWLGVLSDDDLAAYDTAAAAGMSPALRAWSENGRLVAGDPCTVAD